MDAKRSLTFRPSPEDAKLLEALALVTGLSRNEVLRRGLRALAAEHEPHLSEVMATLARLKGQTP